MPTVKAGLHDALSLSQMSYEEQQLVLVIAGVFFATFAKTVMFKGSEYTYVFAKPTEILKNQFNLERELLVLFTPYPTFDARTFDHVDKLMSDYANRLDKLSLILVSKDDDIQEAIRRMTAQEPETRIIVPFSYSELPGLTTDQIIDRLRQAFYSRDLFSLTSPLRTDTYFFGRQALVQTLYDRYKAGEHAGLFGLRKTGKTSLLFALERQLRLSGAPVIFYECESPSFHKRRWYEVLYYIVSHIKDTYPGIKNLPLCKEFDYNEKNAASCFAKDLQLIYLSLRKGRILLIFDEIESITHGIASSDHWNDDKDFLYLWQSIRSVSQTNPTLFSFLIAGVNPKCIESAKVHDIDNPIYRILLPIYLSFFNLEEVKDMVSSIGKYMGLQFDEQVYTFLIRDYGGHPYLIRQACSFIHHKTPSSRPYKYKFYLYDEHKVSIDNSLREYVELILNVLKTRYNDEYELLEMLAAQDYETFDYFVRPSHTLIQHLIGYGLIVQGEQKFHFRIKVVEDYIKEVTRMKPVTMSKADAWKEISARRNALEQRLRKLIKQVIKVQFGVAEGKQKFIDVMSPKQKVEMSAVSFDELFVNDKINLYFNDLRNVVLKYWPEFGKVFGNDRESFDKNMSYINKHRNDAHAKDISSNHLNQLLIAHDWIETKVNDFLG